MHTSVALYHRHRFPAEIISHCVWLYFRFTLSFRDVDGGERRRCASEDYALRTFRLRLPPLNLTIPRGFPAGKRRSAQPSEGAAAPRQRLISPILVHAKQKRRPSSRRSWSQIGATRNLKLFELVDSNKLVK